MQQFRRLTADDLDLCTALAVDRDWSPEEEKWRFLLTAGEGYGLDAPDGGLAAAFVLTRYGTELAAVSMVLVAERFGRQGVGERLMRYALEECGDATAFLCATSIGRPVYERVGFEVDGMVTAYRGRYKHAGGPAVALRPLNGVEDLDREVFGADRSGLLKLLPDFAERAYATADGTGYAAAWRNGATLMVGPVIAGDLDTAAALIDAVVGDDTGPVRLDTADPAMDELVRACGLETYFQVVTMTYGGRQLPGDRTRIRALFMQALG
jgi:GNAT superfamily N-acetyltransferase